MKITQYDITTHHITTRYQHFPQTTQLTIYNHPQHKNLLTLTQKSTKQAGNPLPSPTKSSPSPLKESRARPQRASPSNPLVSRAQPPPQFHIRRKSHVRAGYSIFSARPFREGRLDVFLPRDEATGRAGAASRQVRLTVAARRVTGLA